MDKTIENKPTMLAGTSLMLLLKNMSKECISNNQPEPHQTKPLVPLYLGGEKKVGIDNCIAETIKALNDGGIQTLNSCCGHGAENPSVILFQNATLKDAKKAEKIISKHDKRKWKILSWVLTTINYE